MVERTLMSAQRRFITGDVVLEDAARQTDVGQAPLVFAIFLCIQFLDGALTYWGVMRFGVEVELNGLLASAMAVIGPALTLVAAKGMACACGVLLFVHAYHRALAIVTGICLGVAVVPWLALWFSTFAL